MSTSDDKPTGSFFDAIRDRRRIVSVQATRGIPPGLHLAAAYAWQWCAPTRGALLSGRLPMHSGYAGNTTAQPMNIQPGDPGNGIGMDLRMPLLPGELKRAGFRCHMIGKVRAQPRRALPWAPPC